ncbi:MAG: hypothetical protein JW727_05500, partial [Candidatus Aenigmarchaeota archaeon]|nr:hypothetical protein [Candidatus Aenigmarchaeota archaeon]
MNRTIWVGEIKKDSSYIADANLCVIGYDKGKNEYKNPKKRVYDIAKELSRYTIPEADETRILFSGDSYLLEGPDVRGIIALAKVGFYSDDNFDGFTGVFTGIEPSGLNLLQGRREPLFVMKQYPWHDVALPKGAKEMLNLATKFKIYFEGT